MATILLSDPDPRSRMMLAALIEALGHRVVDEAALEPVDAAVIEPSSRLALAHVRRIRARRHLPVVCVSDRRRGSVAMSLDPIAFIAKPVPVGPFVRAVNAAVEGRRLPQLLVA